MTCIAGIEVGDQVVLGFDSLGAGSFANACTRRDEKGWRQEGKDGQPAFVFGATSSYRMLQVLRFHASPPKLPVVGDDDWRSWDDDRWLRWMVVDYVEHIRKVLKERAVTTIENAVESCGQWLVGAEGGRLLSIGGDFQVERSTYGYNACGSGGYHALGALHALNATGGGVNRAEDLPFALGAAAEHGAGVRAPFHLISTRTEHR